MRLSDLLIDDWIAVPLECDTLEAGLRHLIRLIHAAGSTARDPGGKLARDLAFGSQGDVVRVNHDIVIVMGRHEELDDVALVLGVSRRPFTVTGKVPIRPDPPGPCCSF